MVMFNHLSEYIRFEDGRLLQIKDEEPNQPKEPTQAGHFVTEFHLKNQIPIWRYEMNGIVLEKRVLLIHGQNTVHVTYALRSHHEKIRLELRPSMHFRTHEQPMNTPLTEEY